MDAFEYAYKFTKKAEGGLDPFNTTRYGVTEATLQDAKNLGLVSQSITKVKDLKDSDAEKILHVMYWNKIRGDEMPLDVAVALFDTAVNFSPQKAVRWLQKILKVKVDGRMGQDTIDAIRNCRGDLVGDLLSVRLQEHEAVAKKNVDKQEFLQGWRNRVNGLHYYIDYGPAAPPDPGLTQTPSSANPHQTQPSPRPGYNPASLPYQPQAPNLLREQPFAGPYGGASADTGQTPWQMAMNPYPATPYQNLGLGPSPSLHTPQCSNLLTLSTDPFDRAPKPYPGPNPLPFPSLAGNLLKEQPFATTYGGAPFAADPSPQQSAAAATAPAKFHSVRDTLDFLGEVYALAKPASDATGLSLPFILAHAAHETGWGRRVRGNNLFNLRADESWQGPSIAGDGGKAYRAYPSREESIKDYLAYLQDNPRFGKMFEPVTRGSAERLADALQGAGYADDPAYGKKIMAAASAPVLRHALYLYRPWPPRGRPTGDDMKKEGGASETVQSCVKLGWGNRVRYDRPGPRYSRRTCSVFHSASKAGR